MKNGGFSRAVAGKSGWLWSDEVFITYNMAESFTPPADLSILLKDPILASLLEVVDVKDNEIVLVFENGVFSEVLSPGRHAFWKGLIEWTFVRADVSGIEIPESITKNLLQTRELAGYVRSFVVEPWEQGLLFVNGKLSRQLEPGTYFFWKNAETVQVVKSDMRQLQLEVSGQELLTRDKAALRINFYARYKMLDFVKAYTESKDYDKHLYLALQLALREFIGALTLDELLDRKSSVGEQVQAAVRPLADQLGVELIDSGIRDIILPGEIKEIMNQVLVAEKKAQANTIMRREETASTRSLLNTAKLMEENAMLFKLKEMEYVEKIAEKISNISVSGGDIVGQLRQLFVPQK